MGLALAATQIAHDGGLQSSILKIFLNSDTVESHLSDNKGQK